VANISRNPPLPPFKKGGRGGFLARMRLIKNAAFDHVNLYWLFPIAFSIFDFSMGFPFIPQSAISV
jgi:hypothetical protein